ncbi:glyoxalase [uncultured Chryseobacterium sp.]|uniref:glyoxalase n=1 Tax=uncultured Chryseobacterium sp. TaxID=259322 RepID=UPI002600106C|nr:glyoxalase [uncultured Chryseobacterium sp.]
MTDKTALRPILSIPSSASDTAVERFQNQSLRPILKLQHEIYLTWFYDYARRRNPGFDSLPSEKKHLFIDQSIQNDHALKNTLIGMTVGMLTPEELDFYLLESKACNKRIVAMVAERVKSCV